MAIVNCGYDPPSKGQLKAAVEVDCGFNPGAPAAKVAAESQGNEAPADVLPTGKRARNAVSVRGPA
jgi:hypothetical protein